MVDLSLNLAQLANLSAALFYAFGASQVAVALVLDRWGARRCLLCASVLGLSGAALLALAPSQAWALAGRILDGLGPGLLPGQITYVHVKELAPPAIMQAVGALVSSDPHSLADPKAFSPGWLFIAIGLGLAGMAYL